MSNDPHAPGGWEYALEAARSVPRCGARTRSGIPCAGPAMPNGRCRMHGGGSTGPRTAEGLERSRAAPLKHGGRSAEVRQAASVRGAARRVMTELRGMLRGV